MRRFRVEVDGEVYIVKIEEIGRDEGEREVKRFMPVESFNDMRRREATKSKDKKIKIAHGKNEVMAPMPGKILEIKVEPGQEIEEGEILIVLEAMKLENNIIAPYAARVKEINTQVGVNVEAGDLLLKLE